MSTSLHDAMKQVPGINYIPIWARGPLEEYNALYTYHTDAKKSLQPQNGNTNSTSSLQALQMNFKKDVIALGTEISVIRNKMLGLLNIYRLALLFSKINIVLMLEILKNTKFFHAIAKFFNKDIDQMLKNISKSIPIFNILSVAFFLARLLVDSIILIKHALFASKEEKEKINKAHLRAWEEFKVRYGSMINDIYWSLANFLANFQKITHVSSVAVTWITPAFLAADFIFIVVQYCIERDRHNKISMAIKELQNGKQLLQLRHNAAWANKQRAFDVNMLAASILFLSFNITIFVPGLIASLACFSMCVVAISLYLNAGKAGELREKQWIRDKVKNNNSINYANTNNDNGLSVLNYMVAKTRNELAINIIADIFIPTAVMAIYAISMPTAISLSIVYLIAKYIYKSATSDCEKQKNSLDYKQINFSKEMNPMIQRNL